MKHIGGVELKAASSTPTGTSWWFNESNGVRLSLWHEADGTWTVALHDCVQSGSGSNEPTFRIKGIGQTEAEAKQNFYANVALTRKALAKLRLT